MRARDPLTHRLVSLFNPRRQRWARHCAWSDDGAEVMGLTACGRATVAALQMSNDLYTSVRADWMTFGIHPKQA
jgi:hypothetical protein